MSELNKTQQKVVDDIKDNMDLSDEEIEISEKFIFRMYHRSGLYVEDFAEELSEILKMDIVQSVDKKIEIYDRLVQKARTIRKGVIQDLLAGDIDD